MSLITQVSSMTIRLAVPLLTTYGPLCKGRQITSICHYLCRVSDGNARGCISDSVLHRKTGNFCPLFGNTVATKKAFSGTAPCCKTWFSSVEHLPCRHVNQGQNSFFQPSGPSIGTHLQSSFDPGSRGLCPGHFRTMRSRATTRYPGSSQAQQKDSVPQITSIPVRSPACLNPSM